MRMRAVVAMVFVLGLIGQSRLARAASILTFDSTPGSWIGQGQSLTFSTVSVSRYYSQGAYTNAVTLSAGGYDFTLVEPNYSLPAVGYYNNVTRWPFMGNGAGMWFTAPGRGDNNISGWFNVYQADYAADGSVSAFAVDFKQYDETTTTNWTEGSIRYNSSVPVPGPAAPVPEPTTAALALLGGAILLPRRRSRGAKAACGV